MHYFRMDPYNIHKWLSIDAGIFIVGLYYMLFIRGYEINTNTIWLIVMFVTIPLLLPISRMMDYFGIGSNYLLISKFFHRIKIPIENIHRLKYTATFTTCILTIHYSLNNTVIQKDYEVRTYDTKTLETMNATLKELKPNIDIDVDEAAQKYINKNISVGQGTLITKIGLLAFFGKWFLISAVLTIAFLYFIAPR